MAGIFGGQASGVNAETKDVILEAFIFAPLAIAGRARQYGLHTDSFCIVLNVVWILNWQIKQWRQPHF